MGAAGVNGIDAEMQPVGPQAARRADAQSPRARLGELYDECGPSVYRRLLVVLGDRAAAEDALQAAFLELVRRPDVLGRMESPAAYLLATARRLAVRGKLKGERHREIEAEAARRFLELRAGETAEPDELPRLENALAGLPAEQRQVVMLKAFEGMTFAEIAEAMAIPANTAASRYRYGIEKLRETLSGPNGA